MNYTEAIKLIKPIAESSRGVDMIGLFEPKPITIALEMAIRALEKQMYKKPIKNKYSDNPVCYKYLCPFCGEKVDETEHHCKCGQALEWRD